MKKFSYVMCICAALISISCNKKSDARTNGDNPGGTSIAVFIPGSVSGSATYEMLVNGVQKAAAEFSAANVSVVEAGYNQAEWESKLTALAAVKKYDVIISSNPSLPSITEAVLQKFPNQRFILLDAELSGNRNVYTLRYNQREQSYMAGFLAALLCEESGYNTQGKAPKIGLLSAQEYPVMMNTILPGYTEGAKAVLQDITVDFRVIGNWFDAAKAADIAGSMIGDGAKTILAIAGGANSGVLKSAEDANAYVIWFDTNGYSFKPGVVAGSAVLYQDKAAYNKTKLFLEGGLPFGTAEYAGVLEGYVDFIEDDPDYIKTVSDQVRKKQSAMIQKIKKGELILEQ
ncbi:MAG: BMP family ABC transporter substrate-binding protein [Termitinemataceae bacterium]|nr:MAG: BMP family ABC transporter substrate-binding protein [Termitinemataceae bacterium]